MAQTSNKDNEIIIISTQGTVSEEDTKALEKALQEALKKDSEKK
jgi:hypothetical protein